MIFGIDPGLTGCIAALDRAGALIAHLPMPTLRVGSKNRVNGAAVAAFVLAHAPTGERHAYLELVGSMPKQSPNSMFSFGHSAGLVEGVLAGLGIPYTLVLPQTWKKHAGLMGTDKDASRSRAIQLYPGLRELDLKTKGQALADAILIARAGLLLETSKR